MPPTEGISTNELKSYVDRIERLEEEKAAITADIKSVYDEAGSSGLDKKTLKRVVTLRKTPEEKRDEEQNLIELYLQALDR